jgi:hypothetical protein
VTGRIWLDVLVGVAAALFLSWLALGSPAQIGVLEI